MSQNHLISIILPTYNSETFISETISSVINQTYQNWELIIIDDCSTDSSMSIIDSFSKNEKRIKFFKNKINSGAAISRNIGLENSSGRFISFIDSDDVWELNKLEIQIKFMIVNNCPISFTEYNLIDEKGISLNKTIKVVKEIDYYGYLKNTIIGMSTSMIDSKKTENFKFKNIRTRQDTYLWITLLKRGLTAQGLNMTLVNYRVRKDSISANKYKAAKQVWKLYYHLEKLGLIKSSYYFSYYIFNAIKKRIL